MYGESPIILNNFYEALESAIPDSAVGIKIAKLTGDDTFSLYVTQLPPHSKISPHYHTKDIETYQIVTGNGIMHTAKIAADTTIAWQKPTRVKEGDVFTILPGMIHQLENDTDQPLILIFGCPITHLTTDRFLVSK
jgi:mannose-6-phosphate isomerase-like protein (cupin superfamily)